MGGPLQRLDM